MELVYGGTFKLSSMFSHNTSGSPNSTNCMLIRLSIMLSRINQRLRTDIHVHVGILQRSSLNSEIVNLFYNYNEEQVLFLIAAETAIILGLTFVNFAYSRTSRTIFSSPWLCCEWRKAFSTASHWDDTFLLVFIFTTFQVIDWGRN